MNILMTGGTGFIGSRLVEELVKAHHHLYIFTRQPEKHANTDNISYINYQYPVNKLPAIHAIINLAGESLYGYWSTQKKAAILKSRISTTETLVKIVEKMETKPEVFITGSAVGIYGISNNILFTEKARTAGDDFLATVTSKWEETAKIVENYGVRTIYARFGVVLDQKEGALPLMALPIKLFLGGKIGNGQQWISWIHIDDCVKLLLFSLNEKSLHGPVNITSPNPQRNMDFTKTLANVLQRPSIITTPTSLLKVGLGGMHQLITQGQAVMPQKAIDHDFVFTYPHLDDALTSIFHA